MKAALAVVGSMLLFWWLHTVNPVYAWFFVACFAAHAIDDVVTRLWSKWRANPPPPEDGATSLGNAVVDAASRVKTLDQFIPGNQANLSVRIDGRAFDVVVKARAEEEAS